MPMMAIVKVLSGLAFIGGVFFFLLALTAQAMSDAPESTDGRDAALLALAIAIIGGLAWHLL